MRRSRRPHFQNWSSGCCGNVSAFRDCNEAMITSQHLAVCSHIVMVNSNWRHMSERGIPFNGPDLGSGTLEPQRGIWAGLPTVTGSTPVAPPTITFHNDPTNASHAEPRLQSQVAVGCGGSFPSLRLVRFPQHWEAVTASVPSLPLCKVFSYTFLSVGDQ